MDPLADEIAEHSSFAYVRDNPIRLFDPNGMLDNEYVIDKESGRSVQVSDIGGDEFDIIHDGTIHEDGSISVVPGSTQVVDVQTSRSDMLEVGELRLPGSKVLPGANPAITPVDDPFTSGEVAAVKGIVLFGMFVKNFGDDIINSE